MHAKSDSVRPGTSRPTRECTLGRSPTSVTRVGKPSARGPVFKSIREFTLGRSHSNVRSVGRSSAWIQGLLLTGGSTRERSPMNAQSVGKASVLPQVYELISEFTPARNPSNAMSARRGSVRSHTSSPTRGFTQGRSLTNVTPVGRPLVKSLVSKSIGEFTLGRCRISVRSVGKNSGGAQGFALTWGSTQERNPTRSAVWEAGGLQSGLTLPHTDENPHQRSHLIEGPQCKEPLVCSALRWAPCCWLLKSATKPRGFRRGIILVFCPQLILLPSSLWKRK